MVNRYCRSFILKRSDGLTLLELLVVVAIVSLLATIARIQLNNFIEKARQTEAKSTLAAIFTQEKAFQLESGSYSYCLSKMGFSQADPNRYYGVGFYGVGTPGAFCNNCGPSGSITCLSYAWNSDGSAAATCSPSEASFNPTQYAASGVNISTIQLNMIGVHNGVCPDVSSNAFLIQAAGSISNQGGVDLWSIDHQKNLTHVH